MIFGASSIQIALAVKGITAAAVRIDPERRTVRFEYIERGQRQERDYTFTDIETFVNQHLPSLPVVPDDGVSR
ncbi:MAG: hypothetical protein PHR30_18740 [Gallionellaceae bacterium]|nr:hypothetical protein [Gallionellaceae bacterium]